SGGTITLVTEDVNDATYDVAMSVQGDMTFSFDSESIRYIAVFTKLVNASGTDMVVQYSDDPLDILIESLEDGGTMLGIYDFYRGVTLTEDSGSVRVSSVTDARGGSAPSLSYGTHSFRPDYDPSTGSLVFPELRLV